MFSPVLSTHRNVWLMSLRVYPARMALLERNRSGKGQFIEVALYDTAVMLQHPHTSNWLLCGAKPRLIGNSHDNLAPYALLKAKGCYVVIGAGNSGCDLAVDVANARLESTISIRRGQMFQPKAVFGRPRAELKWHRCAARVRRLWCGWWLVRAGGEKSGGDREVTEFHRILRL